MVWIMSHSQRDDVIMLDKALRRANKDARIYIHRPRNPLILRRRAAKMRTPINARRNSPSKAM
jgi:hypothetical protein